MDKLIREYEDKILNATNETLLPLEVKKIVLQNVMLLVEREADKIIKQQSEQIESEVKNNA